MRNVKLVGLNGRAKAGKDTAAEYLMERYPGIGIKREGFADRMKLSGVRALGFDPATIEEALDIANKIKDTGSIITTWQEPVTSQSGVNYSPSTKRGSRVRNSLVPGRKFWQLYGTEAHREVFDDAFWVNVLLPEPSEHPSHDNRECDNWSSLRRRFPDDNVVIITDVRFDNEARRIRSLGGVVWGINADFRLGPLPDDAHVSERGLNPIFVNQYITNDGDIHEFRKQVDLAFRLTVEA